MKPRPLVNEIILSAVCLTCCLVLYFLPGAKQSDNTSGQTVSAVVLSVDDSSLETHGLLRYGSQVLQVKITHGKWKGQVFNACNEIRAQMELDKYYQPGDKIFVAIQPTDTPDSSVLVALDFNRTSWFWGLGIMFCVLLCLFGGMTGVKALLSFMLSCLVIWKMVIPLALRGWSPAWTIFGAVCVLTAAIQFLVAGCNRKGVVAFVGAISGVLAGLLLSHFVAIGMRLNGAVLPYSQSLYYGGYQFLNLQDLFVGAIILACSGAVMDLAMDIASGVAEVARHNSALTPVQLMKSGCRIGRSVVGTMTTTLLLAYSGGYITLLMMFYVQGNSITSILNNPLVAAETVKTLVGSFALILVAPFTAFFAGILISPKHYSN